MNWRTTILAAVAVVVLGAAALLLHGGAGAGVAPASAVLVQPATKSATQPAGDAAPFKLPDEFAILQTRNPFSPKGSVARQPGTESSLVFKGAVRDGATITALIEDTAVKQVTRDVVGDKLARGKIAAIDLDSLTYAAGGRSKRILVGQNLEGTVVPPTPPPPPPEPARPPMPDQQGPNGPNGPGGPNGMPGMPGGPPGQQGAPPRNSGPSEG